MIFLFQYLYPSFLAIGGISLITLFFWYLNSNFDYWKKRGIPYIKPVPIFGNIRDHALLRVHLGEMLQEIYRQLEGHSYGGMFQFHNPALLVRNPDLIKAILVQEFSHFHDVGFNIDKKSDPMMQNLVFSKGLVWRDLRTNLSPSFSSGRMKTMFQLILECSQQIKLHLAETADKGGIIELNDVLAKFSTDVIGTCAFGLQLNSFANPYAKFCDMGRRTIEPNLFRALKISIRYLFPSIGKFFRIPFVEKDVSDFFLNVFKETIDYREKNNVTRNDFLDLLIKLKNKRRVDDGQENREVQKKSYQHHCENDYSDEFLVSQAFIFFIAGFETTSSTISFALYELAVNPGLQTRLRDEVDATLQECEGKITYEAIQKMEYMDKVVSETLRKYPVVPLIMRECTIPYTFPGSNITIEKGTRILIPVYAIHRDANYYLAPEQFDPERFSTDNKAKIHQYAYLPFGAGPRICIGMRFALVQIKTALLTLLASYEFSVCEGTAIPLKLDPKSLVMSSASGIILRLTNRK